MEIIYNELPHLYEEVERRLAQFESCLHGMPIYRFPFALYNSSIVCMREGNELVCRNKSDYGNQFIANTAIPWEGGYIAIWNVMEQDINIDLLVAKLIHEMYHAHQNEAGDVRFPNEFEATFNYRYNADCMAIKAAENELLLQLASEYDEALFNQLCACKTARRNRFRYEYEYESRIETIEGFAQYAELLALRELSADRYQREFSALLKRVANKSMLLPVRIICYDTGVLLLMAMKNAGYDIAQIAASSATIADSLQKSEDALSIAKDTEIETLLLEDALKLNGIVKNAVADNPMVDCSSTPYRLTGFNIYSARCVDVDGQRYLLSQYFIMYNDGNDDAVLYGDFAVRMAADNTSVLSIYRCNM